MRRISTAGRQSVQAPLNLRKNSLARETITRNQLVVNAARTSIFSLEDTLVRAHSLKLGANTTIRSEIGPNLSTIPILPDYSYGFNLAHP